jgi:hypothetical protein
MVVVARLDRAIQYAAASRFYRERLWNTGSPGRGRAMTVVNVMAWIQFSNSTACKHTFAISPRVFARGMPETSCPSRKKGVGNAGRSMHPQARTQKNKKRVRDRQVHRKSPGIPARNGLRLTS